MAFLGYDMGSPPNRSLGISEAAFSKPLLYILLMDETPFAREIHVVPMI